MKTNELNVQKLIDQGYRRISNMYGIVARIDRPDWIEVLAHQLTIPIRLLSELYKGGSAQDYADTYRRIYSNDKLRLGPELGNQFPTSSWDPVGFAPKKGEKTLEVKLYKWFSKRFTGKYFTLRPKERDMYLHYCAYELGKALRTLAKKQARKGHARWN